jgi:MarR family transcriptional regulator, transcriptional regulator for hemolysin
VTTRASAPAASPAADGPPASSADARTVALTDGLGDDLGWLLLRAARGYLTAATEATADLPGGLRGHHLMQVVAHGCPATQLELAAGLGLDRTVLTYLLDDLAGAGLVERQADPADRRARRVVITAEGRQRLTAVHGRLAGLERSLLPDLPADQRTAVLEALRALCVATGIQTERPGSAC